MLLHIKCRAYLPWAWGASALAPASLLLAL